MGSSERDETLCPVCGYAAEGNHYGILSCRSCASFFKRVVEKGDTFNRHPAPVPGQLFNYCNIRENRNACKQCRYLKCLDTGMQATAVQPKREPTGAQINRKRKTLLNSSNELSDDIQALSVTSQAFEDSIGTSASTSPIRKPSECSNKQQSQKRKQSSVESGSVGTEEKEIEMSFLRKEVLDENSLFNNRPWSFDSDEGSSDDSRGLLGNSNRSSLERGEDMYDDNDEDGEDDHPNMPTWVGKQVECPVCTRGTCNAGLDVFNRLIESFGDHTRQMQLSFTSIDDYIKEMTRGIALREMEPADINKLSNVELAGLLFWVEKMGHFQQIPDDDKINLVKRYSVRKLSLDHFYSASKFKEHAKLRNFVLNNYTYVPADKTGFETPAEDQRQREAKFEIFKNTFERFWTNVIDRFIQLEVRDAEIVFLHFMLMWSPLNKQFVGGTTKKLLISRRNWATQMIFEHFHQKGIADPEIRVGELINLYQEIEVIIDQHCADVHVARLFDFCDLGDYWYDHACYSDINMDRPIDCGLDATKLLGLFADLAHNIRESCNMDPSDVLPELEALRRPNYAQQKDEPLQIIKWMTNRENRQLEKERKRARAEIFGHITNPVDVLVPSTKRGKAMYSIFETTERELHETLNPPSISSVSPEGMNADSPYSYDMSVVRRNLSDE